MRRRIGRVVFAAVVLLLAVACARRSGAGMNPETDEIPADSGTVPGTEPDTGPDTGADIAFGEFILRACAASELPDAVAERIKNAATASPAFILETLECLGGQPDYFRLVDKNHSLPYGYVPPGLVELGSGASFRVTRGGMQLRSDAAGALEEMAAAARRDGIVLTVGSAYRSYEYQVQVYGRIVGEMGQEMADRESARPGSSQHQTGLVVDFSPIDDGFASTPAFAWLAAHASSFGWSLSFPDGFEAVTGYRYESWHYRYTGRDLAAYIDSYFGGVQQYALRFLHEWTLLARQAPL